jgi:capsid protein
MAFKDIFKLFSKAESPTPNPQALVATDSGYKPVYGVYYNGEKNQGAAGPLMKYFNDYYGLRLRCEQLHKESEICQALCYKYDAWVLGRYIRLKCEPNVQTLNLLGIDVTKDELEPFNENVEALWKLYSTTTMCDYSDQRCLQDIAHEAMQSAFKGGDVIVILRVVDKTVKVQLVDASNLITPPMASSNGIDTVMPNGNRVRWGVEIDATGKTVRYWLRTNSFNYMPIEAYDSLGMKRAFLVTFSKDSVDATRGFPALAGCIETAKMEADYRNYTLQAAKTNASIAYTIEHDRDSDGEDPMASRRATREQYPRSGNPNDNMAVDRNGIALAQNITALTGNTTVNMPIGAKMVAHQSTKEVNSSAYCDFQYKILSAMIKMPVCVALSEYNDSFSASRMAGKDWEHTFMSARDKFTKEFFNPIYELQMFIWVSDVNNKIKAKGFLEAVRSKNRMVKEAWLNCDWRGDMFPDIDPLKTVNFLRKAVGNEFMPLMTNEEASEILGQGDYGAILRQVGRELEYAEENGIEDEANEPPEMEAETKSEKED